MTFRGESLDIITERKELLAWNELMVSRAILFSDFKPHGRVSHFCKLKGDVDGHLQSSPCGQHFLIAAGVHLKTLGTDTINRGLLRGFLNPKCAFYHHTLCFLRTAILVVRCHLSEGMSVFIGHYPFF